jgi:uncharacterized circularly permuted ATP-grasp superfamily protein
MHDARQPAIDDYHRLIASDLAGAEQQLGLLRHLQHERKVLFGDRAMAHSLRPTFLTEAMYTAVQDTVYLLRQALLQIAARFFGDPTLLRDELGMEDWEIELAGLPTNIIDLSAMARMDAFFTAASFKFVEVNGESPAGMGYVHELGRIYRSLPVFQAFERTHPVRFISPLEHVTNGLVQCYHGQWDGKEEKPTFAIVDHLDVPTIHEFRIVQAYLERQGFACEISDPRDLEVRDGWIYANGRRIDLLYRRLLMNEYYEIREDCAAYLEGYRARKTCYVNSFRSKMLHKKAIFVFLTDDRFARVLSPEERTAIDAHIPWTRRLRDQRTTYRGQEVDLLPYARAHRDRFVLKPNDEYGGKGVTLGFAASEAEWDAALDEGLRGNYVVQEVVEIHREPFLVQTADGWREVPTIIDLDPYLNGPTLGGCLTRTSASNLANVTAGGGTLPLFILRGTH